MTKDIDRSWAYPHANQGFTAAYGGCPGLTKAEWFAGMALMGIVATPGKPVSALTACQTAIGIGQTMVALLDGKPPATESDEDDP